MEEEKVLITENEELNPNKKKFQETFAANYPDVDMEDEDAYYQALNDQNDQWSKDKGRLEELEDAQRQFGEALDADPRLAELFLEMTKKGGKPIDYLISNYAQAFSDLVNDPENEEYRKALADKITEDVATAKSRKELEEQSEANIDASLDALAKVSGEMGLSDEQVAEAFNKFLEFEEKLNVANVDEDMWRLFINGLNYDASVEQARLEGETAGRNAKIAEKLRSERPSTLAMNGSGSTGSKPKTEPSPNFTQSVWDEE